MVANEMTDTGRGLSGETTTMQSALSPKELAHALGVSESSIKRWIDDGRLDCTRTPGGHRRVTIQNALKFIRPRTGIAAEIRAWCKFELIQSRKVGIRRPIDIRAKYANVDGNFFSDRYRTFYPRWNADIVAYVTDV